MNVGGMLFGIFVMVVGLWFVMLGLFFRWWLGIFNEWVFIGIVIFIFVVMIINWIICMNL